MQNPCAGVTCTTPPTTTCKDSNFLTKYTAIGAICEYGQCVYPSTDYSCPNGCANGTCASCKVCPGGTKCVDVFTGGDPDNCGACGDVCPAIAGAQRGCLYGKCVYGVQAPSPIPSCTQVCSGYGLTCNDAVAGPSGAVTCYQDVQHFGGQASYSINCPTIPSLSQCPAGYRADIALACTCLNPSGSATNDGGAPDPCAGVSCATPPPSICKDSNFQTTYATTGTCEYGQCVYSSTDHFCPNGCVNGSCASCRVCPGGTACIDVYTGGDPDNCGACGSVCPTVPGGERACYYGTCLWNIQATGFPTSCLQVCTGVGLTCNDGITGPGASVACYGSNGGTDFQVGCALVEDVSKCPPGYTAGIAMGCQCSSP